MRDEDYQAEQIAAYGQAGQPAIAARMRPHLRMTQIGNGAAVLAIVAAVAALVRFPDFTGAATGRGWAVLALVSSVLLLAICTFQHLAWVRAMAVWAGRRRENLDSMMRISWVLHAVSYAVVIIGLWACIAGSGFIGWTATSAVLLALAMVFMLGAQVLAGVQYLRPAGPPGTVPAHMRRLIRRVNASR